MKTNGNFVSRFTVIAGVAIAMTLGMVSSAFAQTPPSGGSPAAVAPTNAAPAVATVSTSKVGIGGDCSSATCADGLVCDSGFSLCRNGTAKEQADAREAKAVEAAQKNAQAVADLTAAKQAVTDAHEACKTDATQCGEPVEQVEGHLRELQKSRSISTGATASPNAEVLAFQRNYGLVVDGVAGDKTCNLATSVVKVPATHPVAKVCAAKSAKKAVAGVAAPASIDAKLDAIGEQLDKGFKSVNTRIDGLEVRVIALENPIVAGTDPS